MSQLKLVTFCLLLKKPCGLSSQKFCFLLNRQPGDPGCENYDVEKCRLMKVRNFGVSN